MMEVCKVFCGFKGYNCWVGGVLFNDGYAIFSDVEAGKDFAYRFCLHYEIIYKPIEE